MASSVSASRAPEPVLHQANGVCAAESHLYELLAPSRIQYPRVKVWLRSNGQSVSPGNDSPIDRNSCDPFWIPTHSPSHSECSVHSIPRVPTKSQQRVDNQMTS